MAVVYVAISLSDEMTLLMWMCLLKGRLNAFHYQTHSSMRAKWHYGHLHMDQATDQEMDPEMFAHGSCHKERVTDMCVTCIELFTALFHRHWFNGRCQPEPLRNTLCYRSSRFPAVMLSTRSASISFYISPVITFQGECSIFCQLAWIW